MATPNLLFLFTDEQRFDTMAAYGNARIHTPNLNRLASQSVVFDQAYVTQPVCTPSRSSILTGLYPHTNGCTENNRVLPADVPCLPEMLSRGDYACGYHGKWHLGDELFAQHGFEDWVGIEDAYNGQFSEYRDPNTQSHYHHFLVERGYVPSNGQRFGRAEAARLPEAVGKPAFLAQTASRFIRDHARQPFMLFVNFLEPHMPYFGPRDDQYDPDSVTLPPNFDNAIGETHPLKLRLMAAHYHRNGYGMPLETEADWRRMIAHYWGLCSLVDTHVGTILETLDDCGLTDETIIVYTSDHGDMMGSHRLLAKCTMFEESARVPLLIRMPGQRTQRRVCGPVSQIDLVPTLLDLLDQPIADHLQGQSLAPRVVGEDTAAADRDVFIEWNGPNHGLGPDMKGTVRIPDWMTEMASTDDIASAVTDPVRTIVTTDGWKLNCGTRGEHELYHLADDPFEMRNLAMAPAHQPRMATLAQRIRQWQVEAGDTAPPATVD